MHLTVKAGDADQEGTWFGADTVGEGDRTIWTYTVPHAPPLSAAGLFVQEVIEPKCSTKRDRVDVMGVIDATAAADWGHCASARPNRVGGNCEDLAG